MRTRPITPTQEPFRLLLRPQETANALGISLHGLMNLVAADEIPTVRIGQRNLRFFIDDLRAWIAERSRRPAGGPIDTEEQQVEIGRASDGNAEVGARRPRT